MVPSNPYPWLPDWYWQIYADTINLFWSYVDQIISLARSRGFDIFLIAQTPPQIGSAGTVTLKASCAILNFSDARLFDDRVILSFGGNHLQFLQYWIGATACERLTEVTTEEKKLRPGWKPNREAALVLSEALHKLV